MKKVITIALLLPVAVVSLSAIDIGYSTAPLLSEELLLWEQTRVEMNAITWPTFIGGIYLRDRVEDLPFGWHLDLTFAKGGYEAASDDASYPVTFVYSHNEIHYYGMDNEVYYLGAGIEYIYMKQTLPDDAPFDTYTTTHGYPVLSVGADLRLSMFSVGLKYTFRFFLSEFTSAPGTGEISVLVGASF